MGMTRDEARGRILAKRGSAVDDALATARDAADWNRVRELLIQVYVMGWDDREDDFRERLGLGT